MTMALTAQELFGIAIEIERNGRAFYRTAAAAVPQDDDRSLLLDLAAMEDDHEMTFTEMRDTLAKEDRKAMVVDPDYQIASCLQALSSGKVFDSLSNRL